jgi:L-ascorbate metabolism protein UlaG (beta-lactamase superfamily)
MTGGHQVTLRWHGAAHYQIRYRNLKTLIDPLFTRLPGERPRLEVGRDHLDRIDYLLLTHGHLDHSWDVPYLAAKHGPELYAPAECLPEVRREAERSGRGGGMGSFHALDEVKGVPFRIADIEVTPFQIGTEEIDFWFVRSMFLRPWLHLRPRAIPTGLKWLSHHVFGNCFAFHFVFPAPRRTMLYFGNLTDRVAEIDEVDRVDVLAIPYCPANQKWLPQSQYLIERFQPGVTLVHHFDNFMNPFTLSKYMNLESYGRALHERCPVAKLTFSKFLRDVDLAEIIGG